MRLGGPIKAAYSGPEDWVTQHRRLGYTAAYCPKEIVDEEQESAIRPWVDAAKSAGLVIAEVGAWSSTCGTDEAVRAKNIALCQRRLALAERIGARCCVNVAGSRGEPWNGHHPDNLTPATFDLVVQVTRQIIDAVKPARTFFTLEAMPWQFPNSIESYERLVRAMDRRAFAVHFDPCNLVGGIEAYYATGRLARDFVARLGPHIKSVHAKDISMWHQNTIQISEVRPGLGNLDYRVLLQELARLGPDLPVMMEHLKTEEEYVQAAGHIRSVAKEAGVEFRAA